MAWLQAADSFDPDGFDAPVVGIAATLVGHDSNLHQHKRGQLLYARQGCIRITLAEQLCLLPPSRAAWIPPQTAHGAAMRNVVNYRSLYFTPELCAKLPSQARVIDVSPLLQAVLEPMAIADFEQDWSEQRYLHLLGLCIHEIGAAPSQPMLLPLPSDRRLAMLIARPENLPPTLKVLEGEIGASGKTIGRIFQRETGMGYQQWRQQWRLMRAIELMTTGCSLAHTATELEFSTDTAFIVFFKNMTGRTPKGFFK
ncbi:MULTISPECIES: AraC family transcriptional regulator [Pseudomonas]|uniref:AraC family transcriptional regulator n=1 Tax=Pseudomonas TaxID=286 RepID=UPI001BE6575E|nr:MULTISPECIES: helix-turn-helix transcriptional regulator [Pseudomonas]MBT2341960.1 helix-turn-helix transcriptional regulator [Pseudomonas fluorescens]MCD4532101.1 helix-turn-helix transcriptional regulator [Pseudomonas sp. C3-2018]